MRLTLQGSDPDQRAGQRAYVAWLEARAANDGGRIDEEAMKALATLRISSERKDLEGIRKEDRAKVLVAALLRRKTAAGNSWITERLSMGHHGSLSRLVVAAGKDAKHESEFTKLMNLLKCVT